MTSAIELIGLTKAFGRTEVVRELSLTIGRGELVTLLGPSGCGKTTSLRIIAGLTYPTSGRVLIEGKDVTYLPSYSRGVSMVFQNYGLFPHMTVFDNVAFGLTIRRVARPEVTRRVRELLDLLRLAGLETRFPGQLSGGQQQRVALARAVAIQPKVLLLDEPLSSLDAKLREHTRREIRRIQQELGLTAIYVTHDQEEALTLSDRVVVMHGGEVLQVGSPHDIYNAPRSMFVAEFVGRTNLFEGQVAAASSQGDRVEVRTPSGLVIRGRRPREPLTEAKVVACVRPENIELTTSSPATTADNTFHGTLEDAEFLGAVVRYRARLDSGDSVLIEGSADAAVKGAPGDRGVFIAWSPESVHFIGG